MTALVPEAPPPKKIHIPQKEIDEFFRKNSEGLNSEAKQLFSNMGAEDQRRVLNSGPLNIFKSPMDMYKFRVAISRDREQEIADRKGGEFVAKEAQDYEVKDWIKSNETYLGEEGAKQLDMFGAADQWRIISEGPASESMDPVHIIQTRAKRSRELANTVSVMFAQRREMANEKAEAKAAPKRLFKPELADTVQAFFTRVVGCEVPASQRRTGGFGVQHQLEEDRSKLVGKVKGVDGVVEVLKNKYECLKGERYRVIGERGGPAGMWRLEGGKTIPKTHVKEGGWKWVLEEPEPEAKLAKPPPVATAPVETFVPKELRQEGHEKPQDKAPMPEEKKKQNKKKSESESEESSEDSASEERSESPKKKKVLVKRKVKTVVVKKVVSGDDAKAKRKKRVVSKHQAESESDQEAPKKRRARGRAAADSRDDSREPPAKSKGRGSKRRSQQDSRDGDSRMSEDSRRGEPMSRSKRRR